MVPLLSLSQADCLGPQYRGTSGPKSRRNASRSAYRRSGPVPGHRLGTVAERLGLEGHRHKQEPVGDAGTRPRMR